MEPYTGDRFSLNLIPETSLVSTLYWRQVYFEFNTRDKFRLYLIAETGLN